MLTFDDANHTYQWDGVVVPNVTRVIAPLMDYSKVPSDKLEVARQKGVAVHKMVELHAKGDLDEDSLPTWLRPVLEQWLKFLAESGFRVIASEKRVFHPLYRYAGTPDLFGEMNEDFALIDVKRSFLSGGAIGVQLAAYREAYAVQEGAGKNARRYALKLTENGPYRLEPYSDKNDFSTFLACLAVYNWKEKLK